MIYIYELNLFRIKIIFFPVGVPFMKKVRTNTQMRINVGDNQLGDDCAVIGITIEEESWLERVILFL